MKKRFLSVLMVLCMVLTLMPMAALAEGDTEIATVADLQTAITAADESGTVAMDSDITVAQEETATLDLQGKTVDTKGYTIFVNGTLTITGNGTIKNEVAIKDLTKSSIPAAEFHHLIYVGGTGNLTIENGTFKSITPKALIVVGNAMIEDANISCTIDKDGAASNAYDGESVVMIKGSSAEFTMIKGSVIAPSEAGTNANNGMYAMFGCEGAEVILGDKETNLGPTLTSYFPALGGNNYNATTNYTIYGGDYTSNFANTEQYEKFCAVLYGSADGNINIYGGTFKGNGGSIFSFPYTKTGNNVNIYGGTFETKTGTFYIGTETGKYGNSEGKNISITGGTFSDNPLEYVEDGYVVSSQDGKYIVTRRGHQDGDVAKIGERYFATLTEAITAARANDTIILLEDASISEKITIDKTLTISGGNKTISGVASNAGVYFEITGGTFAISDATLRNFGDTAATVTGAGVFKLPASATGAKIVASGLTVEQFNRAAFDVRNGAFEIKNCTIDCDNKNTDHLTKGIVAGYDTAGTVTGEVSSCTIIGSNSTYGGWSASGIEVSSGATVTVTDTSITSMKGGISVARNYGHGEATVTVSNSTIDAADFALRIFESNNTVAPVANTSAKLTVNGGTYTGDVRISIGDEKKADGSSVISITAGLFSVDPLAFVEDGLISVPEGKFFKVTEKSENAAEVAPPSVPNVITGTEVPESVKEAVETAVKNTESVGLTSAASGAANSNTVTEESGKAELKKVHTVKDEDTVTIYVQPYLDIVVTGADVGEGDAITTLTLNISPMVQTVATTANSADKIDLESNAVAIGEPAALVVTTPVTITIPLPAGFVGDQLQVKHVKDNGKVYYYAAEVTGDTDKKATFTVTNGFSAFTLQAQDARKLTVSFDANGGAEVKAAEYSITNVGDTLPTSSKSGYTFSGWTFTGLSGTYTTLPDLWSATAGTEDFDITATAQFSYNGGGTSSSGYAVNITSAAHGTVTASPRSAAKGTTVTLTVKPDSGYVLDSLSVTDKNGDSVSLNEIGSGKYTFTMPGSSVTVKAAFAEGNATPFTDVSTGDWYYDAVKYVYKAGMMNGTTATSFGPEVTTTRAMIVTILYRLEGEPAVSAASVFTDVAAGQYYTNAVAWASSKNIVGGYGDGKFGPEDTITREQLAAILYRYAQYKGYDVSATNSLNGFADVGQLSSYAEAAMQWANGEGLITGVTGTTLAPTGSATRAQVATILMRFCENVAK